MVQEISRELVDGVWVTRVSEEGAASSGLEAVLVLGNDAGGETITGLGPGVEDTAAVTVAQLQGHTAAPIFGVRLRMGDPLTPVVAEGIGHSIAQAQDTPSIRTFLVNGSPGTIVSQLGGDSMATYNPGPFQRVGVAIQQAAPGLTWCPTTDSGNTNTDDHIYGLPGAAVWETRIGANFGSIPFRLSQRWYSCPGIPDVLYLEVQVSPDWTHAVSAAFNGATNIAVAMETKSDRTEATGGYDPDLDGIGMNGQGASTGYPTYTFLRCLTHPSTGHEYTEDMSIHYDFYAGVLTDPAVDSFTPTANVAYQALLSVQCVPRIDESQVVARFALGLGHSPDEARLATRDIPNVSMAQAVRMHTDKLLQYQALQNATWAERKAWAFHVNTLSYNTITPADTFPGLDFIGNSGEYLEVPSNARSRWSGLWTHDTPLGLLGAVHLNPDMVLDTLRYFFDRRMNQSTGFLYFARPEPGFDHVQIGSFLFARILRRYLAHTEDTAAATALYPKLKLMWTWWTVNAGDNYRHPDWPDVRLFTTAIEHEIQESSPTTSGGNYPSGCDWATAWAYDFTVHMAALAAATGNTADVTMWEQWQDLLYDAIQTYTWDPGQGWFQSTMTAASPDGGQPDNLGRFDQVMTYWAFNHLWAGTATPAQAAIMRTKIMDPAIFRGTYGIRTVDARWAGYSPTDWVKGASRAYYDAACSTGLRRYGYDDDADSILATWTTIQNARGTTPEMINPDVGTGGYARHLLTCNAMMEAYLAKCEPSALFDVGVSQVTS